MSKPEDDLNAGQTTAVLAKTIFLTEGNPVAMLVTNKGGRMSKAKKRFATAEAALAWCRGNMAMLVYSPVALERN